MTVVTNMALDTVESKNDSRCGYQSILFTVLLSLLNLPRQVPYPLHNLYVWFVIITLETEYFLPGILCFFLFPEEVLVVPLITIDA